MHIEVTVEDIRKVTPQILEGYYQKWYVPSLATLIVVGDISPQDIEIKIKEGFSSLQKRPVNIRWNILKVSIYRKSVIRCRLKRKSN